MRQTVSAAVARLETLGHDVAETALPFGGWNEAFGPLVLAEERRERGDLLHEFPDVLSDYVRRSLAAAQTLTDDDIAAGRAAHRAYRARVATLFETWDAIATPATAVTAFPFDKRPKRIAGREVDWLWGAFPFAVPFNVSGNPAVSLPCGLADGLPVGLQLVMPLNEDERLLDLAEDVEEAIAFDWSLMGDPTPLPAVEAAS